MPCDGMLMANNIFNDFFFYVLRIRWDFFEAYSFFCCSLSFLNCCLLLLVLIFCHHFQFYSWPISAHSAILQPHQKGNHLFFLYSIMLSLSFWKQWLYLIIAMVIKLSFIRSFTFAWPSKESFCYLWCTCQIYDLLWQSRSKNIHQWSPTVQWEKSNLHQTFSVIFECYICRIPCRNVSKVIVLLLISNLAVNNGKSHDILQKSGAKTCL